MAPTVPYQANDFPGDPLLHSIQYQPHNHALQNAWVPPAPANGQPEGRREDIPPPVRNVVWPQDLHHLDVAYQGAVDYHPQPRNPAYVFPDVGLAQGIPAQAQPDAPVNQECNPFGFGHVPQNNAPDVVHAVFPRPFVHRIPTPNPAGAENLRRLASRYLHHPDAQVGMVSAEVGAAGRFKVVIVLDSSDVF